MDEVAEIKNRLEITEVVANYLPLKQSGRNLKAACPFHQEKSASFMVSPERGIYHCFGCNEGGDIFSFVMKMEGLEFREALEKLARQAGVELKARKGESADLNRRRARIYEATELAARYFQASLVQNPNALEYVIKKRHLNRETVKAFQIGYAPDSWNALTDFLTKKGFSHAEMLEAGLAGQKEGKTTVYDLFRGRLTFTICDRDGRPIGFTARVLDDSLPKYLNTPQTSLYDKSNAIFGLHLARESIRSNDEVVLVEGNMDVVASHQAGVIQVVAASGTALTLKQLKQLSGLTRKIILAFDSDRAGFEATRRAVPLAQLLGIQLYAFQVEGAKDADELIQQNVSTWKEAISGAREIRDFWIFKGKKDYDLNSSLGKRQFLDRMLEIAKLFSSSTEESDIGRRLNNSLNIDQDVFLSQIAETAKVDIAGIKEALLAESTKRIKQSAMSKNLRSDVNNSQVNANATTISDGFRAKIQSTGKPNMKVQQEEAILAITLAFPLTRLTLQDLSSECFTSKSRAAIYKAIIDSKHELGDVIASRLEEYSIYAKELLMIAENDYGQIEEDKLAFQAFETASIVIKNHYKARQTEIIGRLREAEQQKDEALVQKLSKQYQEILNKSS